MGNGNSEKIKNIVGNTVYKTQLIVVKSQFLYLFTKTAKFLNLAFKTKKIKTKHKNSALC
ncbi:hypothetical protein JCM19274_768 [Algibacter lectus]|uniref:Uncharacterized protein n=1 Tax=Algibacter lectus TaxID=221126 RepID=A0A090WW97_9FLAO|nr:hypothetical protein JCM19274_768 [Algibacter lectus]